MRVLLDESVPRQLAGRLGVHEITTVTHEGWAGLRNGDRRGGPKGQGRPQCVHPGQHPELPGERGQELDHQKGETVVGQTADHEEYERIARRSYLERGPLPREHLDDRREVSRGIALQPRDRVTPEVRHSHGGEGANDDERRQQEAAVASHRDSI